MRLQRHPRVRGDASNKVEPFLIDESINASKVTYDFETDEYSLEVELQNIASDARYVGTLTLSHDELVSLYSCVRVRDKQIRQKLLSVSFDSPKGKQQNSVL